MKHFSILCHGTGQGEVCDASSIQPSSFTCHVNVKIPCRKLNLTKNLLSAAYSLKKNPSRGE